MNAAGWLWWLDLFSLATYEPGRNKGFSQIEKSSKGVAMLKIKRVYESTEESDGIRFLVERLWPRGIKKGELPMEAWLKDAAPSTNLRRWFAHDITKWDEFQRCYRAELDENPDAWKIILETLKQDNITLLYSARDKEHNSAVVLKSFLEEYLRK